jgi:hypothetical protein
MRLNDVRNKMDKAFGFLRDLDGTITTEKLDALASELGDASDVVALLSADAHAYEGVLISIANEQTRLSEVADRIWNHDADTPQVTP